MFDIGLLCEVRVRVKVRVRVRVRVRVYYIAAYLLT
jgi:hypothetical protein